MFKAIYPFADSNDNGHVYLTGDTYPREGYEPTAERLIELGSTANGRGFPVIEQVIEAEAEAPVAEPEANEVPFSEPVTEEEAEATAEAEAEETEEEVQVEEPKEKPVRKTESKSPKAPAKKVGGRRKVSK